MSAKRMWQSSLLVVLGLLAAWFYHPVWADISVPYQNVPEKISVEPIVVGNVLAYYRFKGSSSGWQPYHKGGSFYLIDSVTGKQIKKVDLLENLGKHLATVKNISYFYYQNDAESDSTKTTYYLIAYDLLNAKKIWSTKVENIWDTFCTDASKLYFVSCKTGAVAVNMQDGKIAWKLQLQGLKDDYWSSESCAIKYVPESKSIVVVGEENLFSVDCQSGKSKWKYQPKIVRKSNERPSSRVNLALTGDKCLYLINNSLGLVSLKTGAMVTDFGRVGEVQSFVPLGAGALVFYVKDYSKVYYRVFQGTKPSEERFLRNTSAYNSGAQVLWNNEQKAYVDADGEELICLDYKAGTVLWTKKVLMKGVPFSKGLEMDNEFFVMARAGKAYRDEIPYLLCVTSADGKDYYTKGFDTLFAVQQIGKRLFVGAVNGKIYVVDPPFDKYIKLVDIP